MNDASMKRLLLYLVASLGCCFAIGCKPKVPDIVSVSGTVAINDNPLSNANVVFIPMADGLDGNFSASGVTNDAGEFTLRLPGKTEPGCCACECKILVQEGPLPDGARAEDGSGNDILVEYKRKLKNRPIPAKYQRIGTTPLSENITEENRQLELKLSR